MGRGTRRRWEMGVGRSEIDRKGADAGWERRGFRRDGGCWIQEFRGSSEGGRHQCWGRSVFPRGRFRKRCRRSALPPHSKRGGDLFWRGFFPRPVVRVGVLPEPRERGTTYERGALIPLQRFNFLTLQRLRRAIYFATSTLMTFTRQSAMFLAVFSRAKVS